MKHKTFLQKVIIFISIYILFLILIPILHIILPDKYFYDSYTILNSIKTCSSFSWDESGFNNIGCFYKFLGLENYYLGAIFSFSLAYFLSFFTAFSYIKLTYSSIIIYLIETFLLSIYLGQYSKELIVIMLSSLLLYISRNRFFIFSTIFIVAIYSIYFRKYWFIVLFFLVSLYLVDNFRKHFIKLYFLLWFLFFVIAHYIFNISLTSFRTMVNINREHSLDAQTIINNVLPAQNIIYDFINSLSTFFYFFIPIELFVKISLKYILFIFFEWFLLYIYICIFKILNRCFNRKTNLYKKIKFSLFLLISFTTVQSFFEPDIGSFLKHQVGLMPIHTFLISSFFFFKKYCKNTI